MARIVVFDKEVGRHELYRQWLLEHDLVMTSDATSAVRKIVELVPLPDLVLADWFMSDGVKLIRELQQLHERTPAFVPPPVILTDDLQDPLKFDAMTRSACGHGAADFLPRQLSREIFAGRITGFLSADESAHYEEEDDERGDSPFTVIAELAGGWPVFDNILEQVGIRESKEEMDRLRKFIADWASLPPSARYREAADYYSAFSQNRPTKIANALYRIADAMLFQHGPVGDDEPMS